MRRKYLLGASLAVLLLGATVFTGCSALGTPVEGQSAQTVIDMSYQQKGVSVSGEGKVMVTPDIAVLSLGISAQETTVAVAQSKASDAMSKVMDALAANGIDKKDIQTQRFSIDQVTKWDQDKQVEVLLGYRVTNIVSVKIRTVANAGAIIDAVAVAGGDLTRISGISFTVDNPQPYYTDARKKAMEDAKAKADQMASLSGITLGKPTSISESSYVPVATPVPMPVYKDSAGASAPTSISPGETSITVYVNINYAIE